MPKGAPVKNTRFVIPLIAGIVAVLVLAFIIVNNSVLSWV